MKKAHINKNKLSLVEQISTRLKFFMETLTRMENTKFLTAKEAASIIRTSEPMVFEWVRNGTLTAPVVSRIGRKILINADELETWLRNGGTAQTTAKAA